jgi:aryl-alcohol dehydrogenase-like predicted oxidoreductase
MHLGLGTAAIGRPQYINIKQEQGQQLTLQLFKKRGLQVLNSAYDRGIRYFDTAPGYGFAEELLIDWIDKIRDPKIEIATKWGYTYTANFDPNAKQHEVKDHSLGKLNQQWEQSKKLIPYLSTYQVHSATFESGVLSNQPVLHRLSELKNLHNLRVGITTSGPNQLEVLKQALELEVEGSRLFEVFQVTYNLLDQRIEEIFDNSMVSGQRFVIKEALANGRLFPNKRYRHYQPLYRYLRILADKYSVGVDAIALRFCLDSINPFMVLSGAEQPQHLEYNLMMNQFGLTDEEIQRLKNFKVSTNFYWKERSALVWN